MRHFLNHTEAPAVDLLTIECSHPMCHLNLTWKSPGPTVDFPAVAVKVFIEGDTITVYVNDGKETIPWCRRRVKEYQLCGDMDGLKQRVTWVYPRNGDTTGDEIF